nr:hypothetical protein [Chryseobacterium shigense]
MYDYGWRQYMPDIGRWGVVDPLSEKGHNFSPRWRERLARVHLSPK